MTIKLVFTAFLFDALQGDSVENKSASLLVVPLGKALNGIPPSWCGRQMAGNSYCPKRARYSALITCCDKRINMRLKKSTDQKKWRQLEIGRGYEVWQCKPSGIDSIL